MLIELRVRDFAVIDDLTIELGGGLTALTGETGAGKSIIVDALALLLGERATSDLVRTGAARARVEAVFDVGALSSVLATLDELGLPSEDGLLILRREVAAQGRNRAWVNGSATTAASLGQLGRALVDLHGQHEHQALLSRAAQRDILDAFAGKQELAHSVREAHQELSRRIAEREALRTRGRELAGRADFLRFQWNEIVEAGVEPSEDSDLGVEAARLEHSEELMRESDRMAETLYGAEGSASDVASDVMAQLQRLSAIDSSLEPIREQVSEAYHLLVEAGRQLADYASRIDHDPGRLEDVRARLDLLARLKRKYGPTLDEVVATGARLREELMELDSSEVELGDMDKQIEQLRHDLIERAGWLSKARDGAARLLSKAVQTLMPELGLAGATFQILLEKLPEVSAGGAETVELRASLNPGFDPLPLRKIASGGELSRVMLALKTVLAGVDQVPTLVFDEVDAGVGGAVATAVADKLHAVSRGHQVFVVTHLAQVASRADHHVRVVKGARGGVATTDLQVLDGEGRVEEIARMLGGDPGSVVSREHARELLHVR